MSEHNKMGEMKALRTKREETKLIPECEEYVMSILWNDTRSSMRNCDIQEEMERRFGRKWAEQTVATFIARLKKKGYIKLDHKEGREFFYSAVVTQDEYKEMVKERYEKLFCSNSKCWMHN